MSPTVFPEAIMHRTWNSRSDRVSSRDLVHIIIEVENEFLGQRLADIFPAANDFPDRLDQLRGRTFFCQITRSSCA